MATTMLKMTLRGVLLLMVVLAWAPAGAADDKKGGEQLRRLQQKLRAVEQEKSQLVQGKSELDSQLKEGADKLAVVRRNADNASRQKAALEKDLKAADADKAALADKLAEVEQLLAASTARLAEAGAALRLSEQGIRQRDSELATRATALSECAARNASLHRVGVDLLKQYEQKSCVGTGLQRELLTQIKRVGVENMLDEYRDKLDQELLAQQSKDRQLLARQAAEKVQVEQARIATEQAERARVEHDKTVQRQARQQSELDKMTRKVKSMFENIEW